MNLIYSSLLEIGKANDPMPHGNLAVQPTNFSFVRAPMNRAFAFLNECTGGLADNVIQASSYFFSVVTGSVQFFTNILSFSLAERQPSLEDINKIIAQTFKTLSEKEVQKASLQNAWNLLQQIQEPVERLEVAALFCELSVENPAIMMNLHVLRTTWADIQTIDNPSEHSEIKQFLITLLKRYERKAFTKKARLKKRQEKIQEQNNNLQMDLVEKTNNRPSQKTLQFAKSRTVITFKMDKQNPFQNGAVTGKAEEMLSGKDREAQPFNDYPDEYDNKPEKHQKKFMKNP